MSRSSRLWASLRRQQQHASRHFPYWRTANNKSSGTWNLVRSFSSSPPVEQETTTTTATTTTHFGFTQVPIHEKESHVRSVFDSVADSYDVMNDLMSGGMHRYWKDYLLHQSAVSAMAQAVRRDNLGTSNSSSHQVLKILDVAGGTGDVAFRFLEAAGCPERARSSGTDPVQITVCDINHEMLRVGEQRAQQQYNYSQLKESQALQFVQGNAQELTSFPDSTFDLYTIAFGLRNVTEVDKALQEACRVLKPGGRFMCLEFSSIPNPVFAEIYNLYSFNVIPAMGQFVANDRDSYQYLVESIRKFSNQEELLGRMQQAGFANCKYTNLTGGIVALHEGWKQKKGEGWKKLKK